MDWLPLAREIIARWEGLRLEAYLCPAGVWTIGYGETGPHVKRGLKWTKAQAEAALDDLLKDYGRDVQASIRVPVSANEKAALVSLAYNIGVGALRSSTLLRKLNAGDKQGAAEQFGRWNKSGGRVLAGLTKRRADERRLFLGA